MQIPFPLPKIREFDFTKGQGHNMIKSTKSKLRGKWIRDVKGVRVWCTRAPGRRSTWCAGPRVTVYMKGGVVLLPDVI